MSKTRQYITKSRKETNTQVAGAYINIDRNWLSTPSGVKIDCFGSLGEWVGKNACENDRRRDVVKSDSHDLFNQRTPTALPRDILLWTNLHLKHPLISIQMPDGALLHFYYQNYDRRCRWYLKYNNGLNLECNLPCEQRRTQIFCIWLGSIRVVRNIIEWKIM